MVAVSLMVFPMVNKPVFPFLRSGETANAVEGVAANLFVFLLYLSVAFEFFSPLLAVSFPFLLVWPCLSQVCIDACYCF